MTQGKTIGDESVQDKTGKIWQEWFDLLDSQNCRKKSHKEIVATIKNLDQSVSAWWQQQITAYYEQAVGLRKLHEKESGFDISVTRTMNIPIEDLYSYFSSASKRNGWLKDEKFTIRKETENKSMRVTWEKDNSSLSINFYAKNESKSQVSLQHQKLKSQKEATEVGQFWAEKLALLKTKTQL